MTLIVGIAQSGSVWLGGDRFVGHERAQWTYGTPKIRTGSLPTLNGPPVQYVVGLAGAPRDAQLLQYGITLPAYESGSCVDTYLVNHFVKALRTTLKDHDRLKDGSMASLFLIGFAGRLREITSDFAVIHVDPQEMAIGAGSDIALGSLYNSRASAISPADRIKSVLESGCVHSPWVEAPLDIIEVK